MVEEPDDRPRMTEKRILCVVLTVLFLLLFVGLVVGLVTWYKAEAAANEALAEAHQSWEAKLYYCQRDRYNADARLLKMATNIGCLFEPGTAYHRAVQMALQEANQQDPDSGRPPIREMAPPPDRDKSTQRAPPAARQNSADLTMLSGNYSGAAGAVEAVRRLYEDGVRMFIGLPSSEEMLAVLRWAERHAPDALFVSPSATASDLGAGDGNRLLLSMGDAGLAVALLCLLRQRRVKYLLPVVRADTYGRSLLEELRQATLYDQHGWTVLLEPTLYQRPALESRSGRTGVLASVRSQLARLQGRPGGRALLFVSGGELRWLLEAAGVDPQLTALPWFGTDSVALRADVLASRAARDTAVRVNLTSLIYTEDSALPLSDRLQAGPDQAAPNVQRAYTGASLLAQLSRLLLAEPSGAAGAVLTRLQSAAAAASAAHLGSRSAGGQFAAVRVVSRTRPDRQVLADPNQDVIWVVSGQIRIAPDSREGMYLGRTTMSAAGSAYHLVTRGQVSALYRAVAGCQGDEIEFSGVDPATLAAVSTAYRRDQLPERVFVPAWRPAGMQLHCAGSGSGLVHAQLRCPAVNLPAADTVFCLADTYRLAATNQSEARSGGVRWQHKRHLVQCGTAPSACIDRRQCHEQNSCLSALALELTEWLDEEQVITLP